MSDVHQSMAGSSILLVDDDRNATELLRHLLAKAGFKGALKTVQDPAAALRFVSEALASGTAPELIVVDLSLPGMHGFEVVREIRRLLPWPSGFVVVVSASDNPRDIEGARSAGADAYLEKFPTVADLARVHQVIAQIPSARKFLCLLRKRPAGVNPKTDDFPVTQPPP